MPRIRAWPAFWMIVSAFGPRNENWKSFQSSRKAAPLNRRLLPNQLVFQPSS